MNKFVCYLFLLSACLIVTACDYPGEPHSFPVFEQSQNYPGGATSFSAYPFAATIKTAESINQSDKLDFYAGKALAGQPWIKAPSTTDARDGLGPLYNARTCLTCHKNAGRGKMPDFPNEELSQGFVRLSVPGFDKINGVVAEPSYGEQLQIHSVSLKHQLRNIDNTLVSDEVNPEAKVSILWKTKSFTYSDGHSIQLRFPNIQITQLAYGEMHVDTLFSLRNAPPIYGAGLLELIPQSSIEKLADEFDQNSDGISGKVNQVWDFKQRKTVAGRFGLKANRADLLNTIAGAFAGDIGITNSIFPQQPCSPIQTDCQQTTGGEGSGQFELADELLALVVMFNKNIAVPNARKPDSKINRYGRELFYQIGCAQCHTAKFITREDPLTHLSNQTIWPYSDLLLHDMGSELADGRNDYLATGNEWRTAPLWGIGLSKNINGSENFLHDGRARNIEEAIIWHGGEAEVARLKFSQLDAQQRNSVIHFVESL